MTLSISRTDVECTAFRELISALDAYLRGCYGPEQDNYADFNTLEADSAVIVAFDGDIAVGCGAFRQHDADRVEIKRMFVAPSHRERGVAGMVLAALEEWAGERGFVRAVLETGPLQTQAIALYGRMGYVEIDNFGPYSEMPSSVCFAKAL